ncbi:MAG: serine--tRNA ligase [Armatimonadetes bacterium]|nr:serine--tRNA ligase [Armatimonadota bacterium]
MLDRQRIRENPGRIRDASARKGSDAPLDEFISLDAERRASLTELESQRAEMNRASKSIGLLVAEGKNEEAATVKRQAKALKDAVASGDDRLREIEARLHEVELLIPNPPHQTVPDGDSAESNVEVESWRSKPEFEFEPRPHWEIGERLGILDFAGGGKISGSGFIVFRGLGARLHRALLNFMLQKHTEAHDYTEVYTPYLVNRDTMTGTGQLPKFEDDMYHMERDDLFLIPTAEVPVTGLHRDSILNGEDLPIYYVASSGCFRREAGAAGKDTRGLLRVHQFDKVELVKFCSPAESYNELETLRKDAASVLEELGLHYRVTLLCAGELGFAAAKCYDLEVWAPGVGAYLEVSSCSNFEDFQARRLNIRYRPVKRAKPKFVHTLNASGVALPRLMAALLETYQKADGSVLIPEALRPFMGVDRIQAD